VIEGPAEVMSTRNSLIRSEATMLTTVVGLDGIIVIATADAVLAVAQQHAERVKELVEQLKARKRTEALEGARLSLQKHFHRSEHWVVVHGVAEVTIGEGVRLYHENDPPTFRSARCIASPIPAKSRWN
jgi:mannose-1-phosphate guanylyltransferase/mannose-6-phosphate isomerase